MSGNAFVIAFAVRIVIPGTVSRNSITARRRSSFSAHSIRWRTSRSFASSSETFATASCSFARTSATRSSIVLARSSTFVSFSRISDSFVCRSLLCFSTHDVICSFSRSSSDRTETRRADSSATFAAASRAARRVSSIARRSSSVGPVGAGSNSGSGSGSGGGISSDPGSSRSSVAGGSAVGSFSGPIIQSISSMTVASAFEGAGSTRIGSGSGISTGSMGFDRIRARVAYSSERCGGIEGMLAM